MVEEILCHTITLQNGWNFEMQHIKYFLYLFLSYKILLKPIPRGTIEYKVTLVPNRWQTITSTNDNPAWGILSLSPVSMS